MAGNRMSRDITLLLADLLEGQFDLTCTLRPCLYGLGYRDNPPPELPLARHFSTNLFKNSINRLHEVGETTRVGETTGGGELSRLGR